VMCLAQDTQPWDAGAAGVRFPCGSRAAGSWDEPPVMEHSAHPAGVTCFGSLLRLSSVPANRPGMANEGCLIPRGQGSPGPSKPSALKRMHSCRSSLRRRPLPRHGRNSNPVEIGFKTPPQNYRNADSEVSVNERSQRR